MMMQDKQILSLGQYTGIIEQKVIIDGSILTKTLYNKNTKSSWHSHENLHICFVFQNAKSETRQKTTFTTKAGNCLFYHAGEMHQYQTEGPVSKSANIEIPSNFLKKYGFTELGVKQNLDRKIDSRLLILKLQHEMQLQGKGQEDHLLSLLLEMMSNTENLAKNRPDWVIQLNELLHDHWNDRLELTQMSQILGVHPVTISKNFRKYFACTLGDFKRKLKINKSIELIKSTHLSLSEIAHYCDFADQGHFTRNFKKYTGFLPKEFRQY